MDHLTLLCLAIPPLCFSGFLAEWAVKKLRDRRAEAAYEAGAWRDYEPNFDRIANL